MLGIRDIPNRGSVELMSSSFQEEHGGPFIISAGWLFADLLLALGMLFMISTTFVVRQSAAPPPALKVSPASLDPNSAYCSGKIGTLRCTVTIMETADSIGNVDWSVSSDMNPRGSFSPTKGRLTPGSAIKVTISALPCQYGLFIVTGSRKAAAVSVPWRCQDRLDFDYQAFALTVQDVNELLNGNRQAINTVKQQVRKQRFLAKRNVGLAIVYGGAPDVNGIDQAQHIADKVYSILRELGTENFAFQRSSYYAPLYVLGNDPGIVKVDVYLFQQ
jgi:hypothetical protein